VEEDWRRQEGGGEVTGCGILPPRPPKIPNNLF